MNCYCCGNLLNRENESLEHILPNFLGGKLKSKGLLCKKCNNTLGSEIETPLSEELFYHRLIPIKKDRKGGNRQIEGTVENQGFDLLVNNLGQAKFYKPQLIFDEDGNPKSVVALDQQQAEDILKNYEKKNPQFNSQNFLSKAKWSEMGDQLFRINFSNHTFGSELAYRGVAKIALNFYLIKNDRKNCKEITDYVCKGIKVTRLVQFFYPLYEPYIPRNGEITHVIYIRGNFKKSLLYGYIEIFNVAKFIIILNNQYYGNDFEDTFIWNPLLSKQIEGKVNLNLLYSPLIYKENKEDIQNEHTKYFDRFLRKIEKIYKS